MGSPYSHGRDDNVGGGYNFDAEPDVDGGGGTLADFTEFAFDHNGSLGLNERDYRAPENRPS